MVSVSFLNKLSRAVDEIESRSEPRQWQVVTVRRGYNEDPDAARERHYAAHPEDRHADVVIWHFLDDQETTDESRD